MRNRLLLIFIFLLLYACSKGSYKISYPKNYPKPIYNFKQNPLKKDIIAIGKALFYDPILSADSSISCASCHSPYNAFAHSDHTLSHGIRDQIGNRNAPALMNLAWQKSFMWDGAIVRLDAQALAPISHPKEMGSTIEQVVMKLNRSETYRKLFWNAFKDSLVTSPKVMKSLAQFQLTFVSFNSKYDSVQNGLAKFSPQEINGYKLFLKNCNGCHKEPLFSTYDFENNGLSVDTTLNDKGKFTISLQSNDSLKFKIPSLRNLSYSFPYMHDGRFRSLQQVLNHYVKGIRAYPTLSNKLQNGIALTSNEKVDIIAFLLTLNDKNFIFNKNISFPKKN